MLEKVVETFERFTFLSPKDYIQLVSICKISFVKKNEHLMLEGDFNYNVYAVLKGLLRHYHLDHDGVDRSLRFVSEKQPAGSLECIINGMAATENIEALENTILLKFDVRKFDELASNNIRLLKAQNIVLKELVSENVNHIKYLNVLTPEERYFTFKKEYPKLENRLKQKHLASYLGVTPSSLSRLKARINDED